MSPASDESEPIVGVLAIYKVCTHLGCIYDWNGANERFNVLPWLKYRLTGGASRSAPRSLDRFRVEALDANQEVLATADTVVIADTTHAPLVLPDEQPPSVWIRAAGSMSAAAALRAAR